MPYAEEPVGESNKANTSTPGELSSGNSANPYNNTLTEEEKAKILRELSIGYLGHGGGLETMGENAMGWSGEEVPTSASSREEADENATEVSEERLSGARADNEERQAGISQGIPSAGDEASSNTGLGGAGRGRNDENEKGAHAVPTASYKDALMHSSNGVEIEKGDDEVSSDHPQPNSYPLMRVKEQVVQDPSGLHVNAAQQTSEAAAAGTSRGARVDGSRLRSETSSVRESPSTANGSTEVPPLMIPLSKSSAHTETQASGGGRSGSSTSSLQRPGSRQPAPPPGSAEGRAEQQELLLPLRNSRMVPTGGSGSGSGRSSSKSARAGERREGGEAEAEYASSSGSSTPRTPSSGRRQLSKRKRARQLAALSNQTAGNITVLTCESKVAEGATSVAYVLGTAHVSRDSCDDVRALIQAVQPDVVFVEVCSDRIAMLLPAQDLQVASMQELLAVWRSKKTNAFAVAYAWLLAKIGEKMEVYPGEEFRVAYSEAVACGAMVKLGDRPVQVTLKRAWARLSTWHRVKLVGSLLLQALWLPSAQQLQDLMEELKDSDMLTLAIKDMGRTFPTLLETLITERDM
eukprot:jgi/Mesen1/963/ME000012S00513